jgi:queuosine precursor transporter
MDHVAAKPSSPIAPSLLALLPLYGGLVVLTGFLGNKQIDLGNFAMEVGLLAYIGVVALSSAATELHGRELADRLVLFGFLPILASMALIALVLAFPYSARMEPDRVAAFEMIFAQSPRIMLAGIAAYFVSVFLNVRIFTWLRGRAGQSNPGSNGALMLHGAIASAAAQSVDGLIFVTFAFYGVFPILPLLVGQIGAKIFLSFTAVPLLIHAAVRVGHRLDRETGA